jgi:DNA-binding NarL/FixJ family response regulator
MVLKVIIVEDSAIFRSGIKQILCEEFGLVEVTHSAPVSEALDWASGPWDLAFVTVDLPGPEKLQFIAELKRAYPNQRVIALASRTIIPHLEEVLNGYVWRLIAVEGTRGELVTAVRDTITGDERAVSGNPGIGSLPGSRAGTPLKEGLSKREREVLRLVAAGMTIKEVAATLEVSASTVSTYRVRMLRKLRLKNTAELIRYAIVERLAD